MYCLVLRHSIKYDWQKYTVDRSSILRRPCPGHGAYLLKLFVNIRAMLTYRPQDEKRFALLLKFSQFPEVPGKEFWGFAQCPVILMQLVFISLRKLCKGANAHLGMNFGLGPLVQVMYFESVHVFLLGFNRENRRSWSSFVLFFHF